MQKNPKNKFDFSIMMGPKDAKGVDIVKHE
jgi:hypothetical protein